MTETHEALVRDLDGARGDRAARALYRTFGSELYGFVFSRLGDRELAEEVVQDVFERVWRHAGAYDAGRGSVRTWLYGIARHAVIDAERRRTRRPATAEQDPDETASTDEPLEQVMLRWQVQLAFSRLTLEHREVVSLAQVEGLKLREIAERTRLPLGTVKSRMYYAMENLRLALEELGVRP